MMTCFPDETAVMPRGFIPALAFSAACAAAAVRVSVPTNFLRVYVGLGRGSVERPSRAGCNDGVSERAIDLSVPRDGTLRKQPGGLSWTTMKILMGRRGHEAVEGTFLFGLGSSNLQLGPARDSSRPLCWHRRGADSPGFSFVLLEHFRSGKVYNALENVGTLHDPDNHPVHLSPSARYKLASNTFGAHTTFSEPVDSDIMPAAADLFPIPDKATTG